MIALAATQHGHTALDNNFGLAHVLGSLGHAYYQQDGHNDAATALTEGYRHVGELSDLAASLHILSQAYHLTERYEALRETRAVYVEIEGRVISGIRPLLRGGIEEAVALFREVGNMITSSRSRKRSVGWR